MKIGITADLHLKSKDETPERYNALENIIADLRSKNINRLIVAGDLFDRERYNYNDFDAFCKQYFLYSRCDGNH
jgi:DNA repair exonuclease SbcCD nuclease subunit